MSALCKPVRSNATAIRPAAVLTKRPISLRENRKKPILKKKDRSPAYALSILGKILYRRIKRSTLVAKGINFVTNVSSGSFLDWSSRLLHSTNNETKNDNCKVTGEDDDEIDLLPAITNLYEETADVNSNVNARVTSGTRQDTEQNPACQPRAPQNPSRNVKQKLRRPGRHRGLVARSIGKPRPPEQRRTGRNLKYKMARTLKEKKKLKARNVLVKRFRTQAMTKSVEKEGLTHIGILGRSMTIKTPNVADRSKEIRGKSCSKTEASSSKVKSTDVQTVPVCAATSKVAKRKVRKWRTLMKLGNTVLARHVVVHTTTPKRKREKRAVEQKTKKDATRSESAARSDDISLPVEGKDLSSDTTEWPELPTSGRTRACAKETATEIVKNKHNASATKTTRKIFAENVTKRGKEISLIHGVNNHQLKDKRKLEPGQGSQKTWASVAAAGTVKSEPYVGKTLAVYKSDPCVEASTAAVPSGSGNHKKKRKKFDHRLAYSDKIWLTCQKSKGNPYLQSHCRENVFDKKDEGTKRKNALASPLKKMNPGKPIEAIHSGKKISASLDEISVSQTSLENYCLKSSSSAVRLESGAHLKCDCQGQNLCLVDNMPEVYTKTAGKVITLKESNHDRTIHKIKNVNKCNNQNHRDKQRSTRSNRMGIGNASNKTDELSDFSGIDLCSQLSSMTFQTPTTSNCTVTKNPSQTCDNRQLAQGVGQCSVTKTPADGAGASTKQKKVSLRYRALCRDGCGPLDARTVSDIHTRHRRADTLHDSKVATRAQRRRHRVEYQDTAHSSRRLPAVSDTNDVKQRSDVGNDRPSAKSDTVKNGKTRTGVGSRANRRLNTRKTQATLSDNDNSHRARTSRNVGLVEIDSSTSKDSTEETVTWRPDDNSGANNSHGLDDGGEVGKCKSSIVGVLGTVNRIRNPADLRADGSSG